MASVELQSVRNTSPDVDEAGYLSASQTSASRVVSAPPQSTKVAMSRKTLALSDTPTPHTPRTPTTSVQDVPGAYKEDNVYDLLHPEARAPHSKSWSVTVAVVLSAVAVLVSVCACCLVLVYFNKLGDLRQRVDLQEGIGQLRQELRQTVGGGDGDGEDGGGGGGGDGEGGRSLELNAGGGESLRAEVTEKEERLKGKIDDLDKRLSDALARLVDRQYVDGMEARFKSDLDKRALKTDLDLKADKVNVDELEMSLKSDIERKVDLEVIDGLNASIIDISTIKASSDQILQDLETSLKDELRQKTDKQQTIFLENLIKEKADIQIVNRLNASLKGKASKEEIRDIETLKNELQNINKSMKAEFELKADKRAIVDLENKIKSNNFSQNSLKVELSTKADKQEVDELRIYLKDAIINKANLTQMHALETSLKSKLELKADKEIVVKTNMSLREEINKKADNQQLVDIETGIAAQLGQKASKEVVDVINNSLKTQLVQKADKHVIDIINTSLKAELDKKTDSSQTTALEKLLKSDLQHHVVTQDQRIDDLEQSLQEIKGMDNCWACCYLYPSLSCTGRTHFFINKPKQHIPWRRPVAFQCLVYPSEANKLLKI